MSSLLSSLLPSYACGTSRKMVSVEDRYFSLNRALLLTIGLWPYKKSKLARLHLIFFFSILITSVIFQFTTFVTSNCTTDLIIKVLCVACFQICLIIMYNSFYVNAGAMRWLMEQTQCIYNDIKDDNEIAIIEKYGSHAKRCTAMLTIFVVCVICTIIIAPFWQDFCHMILLINQSQAHRLYIRTEYFIDEEKYFYLLFLHMNVAYCIGLLTILATGTMLMVHLLHACGMFSIANYRIQHAMEINTHYTQNVILPYENMIYERLIDAIDMHRKAMMCSKYIITSFEKSFMLLIGFGVLSLSLNMYRIFQIVRVDHNIEEFCILFLFTSCIILYMFLTNFTGQKIIDHNNNIFITVYDIQWYITSLHTQKLILFLLQRKNKVFGLYIGGLFLASLQYFATLTNASISYFTIMYSIE
ncbi:odorant receptor 22c-like isoform X1 [Linepithema humile]|uniref:odorant receptor 22c-like isoform X1 n=1 Tax=Linepithema humile TaxID=83485 RepID=UPI00351F268D